MISNSYCFFLPRKVLEQREEVYEKIAQYLQLKNVIERMQVAWNCFQCFIFTLFLLCYGAALKFRSPGQKYLNLCPFPSGNRRKRADNSSGPRLQFLCQCRSVSSTKPVHCCFLVYFHLLFATLLSVYERSVSGIKKCFLAKGSGSHRMGKW